MRISGQIRCGKHRLSGYFDQACEWPEIAWVHVNLEFAFFGFKALIILLGLMSRYLI